MSNPKNDQVDINVKELSQHVYQHQTEPRDLDYRAQAFSFAIQHHHGVGGSNINSVIQTAETIETYLRNGAA